MFSPPHEAWGGRGFFLSVKRKLCDVIKSESSDLSRKNVTMVENTGVSQ